MKKERYELLEFLGGLAMLVIGLFIFTNKVTVQTAFFSGTFVIWGVNINSGLVIIPFIIGTVLLFARPHSFIAKIITGLGLLLIIISIVTTTTIMLPRISLFEWLMYLVLIFGGLGLVCRALFAAGKGDKE